MGIYNNISIDKNIRQTEREITEKTVAKETSCEAALKANHEGRFKIFKTTIVRRPEQGECEQPGDQNG